MKTQKKGSQTNQATRRRKTRWLDRFLDWLTIALAFIAVVIAFYDPVLALMDYPLCAEERDMELKRVGCLLGTSGKKETLTFMGIVIGGLVLWQRARSAEKQAEATKNAARNQARAAKSQAKATSNQAKAIKLAEARHAQERLKTSIEHLGSDKASVRIGAAYELYHLAKDHRGYLKTVCYILCKHIRQKTQEKDYKEAQKNEPSEEIITSLSLLCGKEEEYPFSQCLIDLSSSFLRGADLSDAHLQGADLSGAQLQGAKLSRAQLREAKLSWARLQGADLSDAHLQGADLSGAQLQGAKLLWSHLQEARLLMAQLQGADLSGAQLHGADLSGAQLHVADLSEAQLQGVNSSGHPQRSFQDRIRAGIEKESDFSNAVFRGGLSADQVKEIISSMPDRMEDKERRNMKDRLSEHVDKKAGNKLPDNSGAITGAYTKDEAEKWIAEYEKSTSYQSATNESKSSAT